MYMCVYIYIYICVSEPGKCQPMLVQVLKQLLVTVAAVTVCWPYGPLPFPAPFGRIIASCCWTPMSVKNTPEEKKALEKTSFQSYTILQYNIVQYTIIPNQGLENSPGCWIARQRLAERATPTTTTTTTTTTIIITYCYYPKP